MKSFFYTYKIHRILFSLLLLVTVLDPGNDIFKMKEVLFVFTFLVGLVQFRSYVTFNVLIGSMFFSLVFPIIWLFLGFGFNYDFSLEYGIMYLKSFAFFLLINVSLDARIDFSKQFAIATLFIIPLTIVLFFAVDEFQVADVFYTQFDKTFLISRRSFGGIIFDPVVFYKTSPLLIFGLSYFCQEKRFKYGIFNVILIISCLVTMVISGTRANMAGSLFILVYFIYRNYISVSEIRKGFFWFFSAITFVVFLIPFLNEYVFDKEEQSNEAKLSLINDYFLFWHSNIFSVVFGQGLGGGFSTSERGFSYMAEPTYFEIIRMFGLVGGFVFFFFLTIPLFLFLSSKSSALFEKNFYILVAYIVYILIEIPSNPLLLSSTGMIAMVIVYSTSIKVFYTRNQEINLSY